MSSHDADTPKTTITSLPTELIVRIVRLSTPKPSWDNATERSAHLRNLALVCRAFRGPAQEELFRHVILPSLAASRAFVAVLKSRAGARFASTPRSLRVGTDGEKTINQDKIAIPFIAKRCSRLESMWLLNVDALDIAAVTSGTGLRELFCYGCRFGTSLHDQKLEASPLVRLGINGCFDLEFLDPDYLPNLKSFDSSRVPDHQGGNLCAFTNSLGGQLSSLCIDSLSHRGFMPGVDIAPKSLTNLLILDIRLPDIDIPSLLSSIPSCIRHLRAQRSREHSMAATHYVWASNFVENYLEESKFPCLDGLEHYRCGTDDFGRRLLVAKML
ncbi:hypothetical protein RQP46_005217 [Phenoliferia psychrophenolica]